MIRNALSYIVGLSTPEAKEVIFPDGSKGIYSNSDLCRVDPYIPRASAIEMNTLGSFVDYVNANIDSMAERMIVHIKDCTTVELYSQLDEDRKREYLVSVKAKLPEFTFGQFIEQERFCINLQSKFIDSDDRALLLKFAGTVESGTVAEYGDDGVSQKATVKTGIASKGEAIIPSPVKLRPYRTFLEVSQPASDFVFRMKESMGVNCALFEADGGAWELEAIKSIKEYLEQTLPDEGFTIIA